MLNSEVKLGGRYGARIGKGPGKVVDIKITTVHPKGGWFALNLETRRYIHIRSAARLRYDLDLVEEQQAKVDRALAIARGVLQPSK